LTQFHNHGFLLTITKIPHPRCYRLIAFAATSIPRRPAITMPFYDRGAPRSH
jgi:hypothetical protein